MRYVYSVVAPVPESDLRPGDVVIHDPAEAEPFLLVRPITRPPPSSLSAPEPSFRGSRPQRPRLRLLK